MEFRPVAFVCVSDPACRATLVSTLEDAGWRVLVRPTGFHVVQDLADVIAGDAPWDRPGLVVIDALARGCTGASLAEGLRDLGTRIPVVLVTRECARVSDGDIITVDPALAPHVLAELARPRSPVKFLAPRRAAA